MSRTTHRSLRFLTGAALGALLVSVVLPAAPAGSATTESVTASALAASPAEDEGTFLTLLNQERRHAGLAPMVLDGRLAQTARDWSSVMAAQDRLSHDSNLAAVATSVESRWSSAGENVGVGYDATRLHHAFMNSPAHRDNVMSSRFNRVGVGVVHANGKLWVAVRFLDGPAISGSTGQASAPPPAPALPPLPSTPVRSITNACPSKSTLVTPFLDLEGNAHAKNVACALLWDLVAGRSETEFAPNAPMTRAQLATFIARLIEASGKPLPAEPFDAFVDDWGSAHELSINQLAAVGVVKGRGQHYDPNTTVTRGEMATIVVRAHDLIAGSPLPPGVDRFRDDESSAHEDSINKIATAGIAAGNTSSTFAPKNPVVRGQMATFLTRTLDLLISRGAVAPAEL